MEGYRAMSQQLECNRGVTDAKKEVYLPRGVRPGSE